MKNKCRVLLFCKDVVFIISVRFRRVVIFEVFLLISHINSSPLHKLDRLVLPYNYPSHNIGLMLLAGDVKFSMIRGFGYFTRVFALIYKLNLYVG